MRKPDGRGEGEPQAGLIDLFAEAVQKGLRVLLLPADRCAELGAGSSEEVEGVPGVALAAQTIELYRESRDILSVKVVQRHCKAQDRELPGAEQPAMFLG
ncbi:hypothetical protein ABIB73_002029 [Bradyrhizobium sp. F1.4.3]|uniref:hypothetical protein n=1 Tax=Bradyrhizobium sp. F1.4.3 TaxID=3156356 RepID=UPI00339174A2